ncbi:MAG: hypothetical protein EAY65_04340 [Alphaproteobacteria bacterium]|nr:MAG: hypothetical protein EAY65_04340 [Alphaproteobacteria bacterium]
MSDVQSITVAELDASHASTSGAHVGASQEKAGMPQLDFSTYSSQVFWLLVTFGMLYLLVARSILPRIHDVMERRFDRLERDLARAQELAEDAEKSKIHYEALAKDARHQANLMMERAVKEQEARLDDMMHQADAQVAQMMEQSHRVMEEKRASIQQQLSVVSESVTQILIKELTNITSDMDKVRSAFTALER